MTDANETHRNDVSYNETDDYTDFPVLNAVVDGIERPGKELIMFMAKSGVGTTTMVAAVATELAARGHEVLLTTTDPACSSCRNAWPRHALLDCKPH